MEGYIGSYLGWGAKKMIRQLLQDLVPNTGQYKLSCQPSPQIYINGWKKGNNPKFNPLLNRTKNSSIEKKLYIYVSFF